MAIDSRFADWYKAASIDPRSVPLEKRWAALAGFVKSMDAPSVPDLVRMATRNPVAADDVKARFQQSFKAGDPAFLLIDNDQELAVLASAALIQVLATNSVRGDLVALILRTAQFLAWMPILRELTTAAESYLLRRSLSLRSNDAPKTSAVASAGWGGAIDAVQAELTKAGQPTWAAALAPLATFAPAEASATTKNLQSILEFAGRAARVFGEEMNILWWLFGERSAIHNRSWSEVGSIAATFAAPVELDELVVLVPGPVASGDFLSRALLAAGGDPGQPIAIGELIAGAGAACLERLPRLDRTLGSATPLLTAARLWVAGDESWLGRAELASGVSLRKPRASREVSAEVLNELWTVRVLASEGS